MPGSHETHATVDAWITREATPFSLDAAESFNAAVDRMISSLGREVSLLGLGEPLHGGDEFLVLRNRLFERLVEAHGYRAIAVESSFPRGLRVNDHITGRGPDTYEAVQDSGFSHDFGKLDANRELVASMRHYNADPAHAVKLHFYGIDAPTEAHATESPRQTIQVTLTYLASLDADAAQRHRDLIEPLLGADADWENPAAMRDPSKAIGRSPAANALRLAVEDLTTELRVRRPELSAQGGRDRYLEALHHASIARQLLGYHAALAGQHPPGTLLGTLLSMRDAMMAENLAYIAAREQGRGKVLIFAHNGHLQRSKVIRSWGQFWPVGAHLDDMFGPRYAVLGAALGTSEPNGLGEPEAGSLEAHLMALPGSGCFIPTHRGQGLPSAEIAALPLRSGGKKNPSYSPLSPRSLADFDGLAVLQTATYTRGASPLPERPGAS
ncbi:erythromycin esterase family protein [Chondromyces apiculatus]|uniref:Erythromycin esterase n=1 Tax=Chondromyces apiculatus DSM 436 TaxID=1192034 RepID=A0A017SVS4_9BACT|nr:erythromycin esterase family protein [Chondromyces apiculatus]EYF01058.1 Hypothetical protein CAP_8771 [Chondromyces apiculatus DSM 436]